MRPFYRIKRIKHTVFVVLGLKISIRNKSAPDYDFIMTGRERKCFEKYVLKSRNYLEFGMGGSTIFYLRNSGGKVCSVEANSRWLEFLRRKNVIAKAEACDRLKICQADIGPLGECGYPVNESAREKFPDYSQAVFRQTAQKFDLILADGRFRVACVLASIIHQRGNNPLIAVHDFRFRGKYHPIVKYLDKVERADSLCVFRIKKDINAEELLADYEKYKYNFE